MRSPCARTIRWRLPLVTPISKKLSSLSQTQLPRPAQLQRAYRPLAIQCPARTSLQAGHRRAAAAAGGQAEAPEAATSDAEEAILPATSTRLPAPCTTTTHVAQVAIHDFALVPAAVVALAPGLTVVTGESGAGKSVLLSALALALGGPLPAEAAAALIRPPARVAAVEATLVLAPGDAAAVAVALQGVGLATKAAALASPSPSSALTLRRELSLEAGAHVRSRCFLNGAPVPLKALRAVGGLLADINGQGAAAGLRDAGGQARLLDALAGTAPAAAAWRAGLAALRAAEAVARPPSGYADGDGEARRGALQATVDAVAAAGPAPGEDAALRAALRAGEARAAASDSASAVAAAADPGGSLAAALADAEALARSAAAAERAAGASPATTNSEEGEDAPSSTSPLSLITDAARSLAAARAALATAGERSAAYARGHRRAAAEAEAAAGRLAELKAVAVTVLGQRASTAAGVADALLAAAAAADAELQDWGGSEARRAEAAERVGRLRVSLASDAAALSSRRKASAGRLRSAVGDALAGLGLPAARFEVRVGWTPANRCEEGGAPTTGTGTSLVVGEAAASTAGEAPGVYIIPPLPPAPAHASTTSPADPAGGGLDTIEFLWAAGGAEALRPLAAAASGGEAARVALALRAARGAIVAADEAEYSAAGGGTPLSYPTCAGSPPILVVDELDAGVGGRLGDAFGRTLARLCNVRGGPAGPVSQVLAVSHLPQVAAHADVHLRVAKQAAGGAGGDGAGARIVTGFEALTDEGARRAELAAMLGPQFGAAEADALLQSARSGE